MSSLTVLNLVILARRPQITNYGRPITNNPPTDQEVKSRGKESRSFFVAGELRV